MSQNVSLQTSTTEMRSPLVLENQGQKIFAVLHKPATHTPCPVVVLLHGLGGHKVGRYRIGVDLSTQLAQQGIATLRFDFRGSGDSEGEYSAITIEDQISDAILVLERVAQFPEIDPSRIGICGRSWGGALSVLAASRFKGIKSLCLWAPIFDSQQWEVRRSAWHAIDTDKTKEQELLTFEGQIMGLEFFQQFFRLDIASSLTTLDNTPLFVIHGNQDEQVLVSHGERYMHARQKAAAKTRFLQLPKSDHHFTDLPERIIALQETANWFQKTL